jgi:undecaprenyl diphosphate synthase
MAPRRDRARRAQARCRPRSHAAERSPRTPIDAAVLRRHLDTAACPIPDLVIRTSGEERLSNFLLMAGGLQRTGLSSLLLADFTARDLREALEAMRARDRRSAADVAQERRL